MKTKDDVANDAEKARRRSEKKRLERLAKGEVTNSQSYNLSILQSYNFIILQSYLFTILQSYNLTTLLMLFVSYNKVFMLCILGLDRT